MLSKVQKKLENLIEGSLGARPLLIAAVSGGADSVCLLLVLKELSGQMGFDLEAVHVEHGIRGEESRKDAVFVENLCRRLSVPCRVESVDVPSYSKENGIGTEEAARILRYEAFSRCARERNGRIVLAHHMEDNAETVIFQMIRGSSLNGLSGISAYRQDKDGVVYLRPLLDVRRKEIEEYLKQKEQEYRTDSTNEQTEYRRNYLRKEVLPRLCEINSAAVPHISQAAAFLDEVNDYIHIEAQKEMARLCRKENEELILEAEKFINLHPALKKEVIYEIIAQEAGSKKDITSVHVDAVLTLLESQSGKQVSLPYQVTVRKVFGMLVFGKGQKAPVQKEKLWVSEGMLADWETKKEAVEIVLPQNDGVLIFRVFPYDGSPEKIPKKSCTKWMDYDKIKDSFCIRTRENGDFFISDAKGHRKKLKTYFIDEKIPSDKRNGMWLLTQGSQVMWIVGGRISEHVKVSAETKTILEIQYIGGK